MYALVFERERERGREECCQVWYMYIIKNRSGSYAIVSVTCNYNPPPPPGAIAGIVLAIIAFVVIAVAIAIIVAILVYKLRTGKWFKLRHKDEEKLTVDFEKEWLMDPVDDPEKQNMGSLKRMLSWGKTNVSVMMHVLLNVVYA